MLMIIYHQKKGKVFKMANNNNSGDERVVFLPRKIKIALIFLMNKKIRKKAHESEKNKNKAESTTFRLNTFRLITIRLKGFVSITIRLNYDSSHYCSSQIRFVSLLFVSIFI
ncbi:hypothetical protein RF11_03652 [Thelohanellus kitauei]|uniref:Uncharacterized protein n=1 Tax=Thelohanellus kitauei TaxID=669202 RepID=A0A0C2MYJ0_THEKT|nr:hypothetical protein RF11_03652 [Thelohanellus kitauei]